MKMRSGITFSIFICSSLIFVDEVCGMRYEDVVPQMQVRPHSDLMQPLESKVISHTHTHANSRARAHTHTHTHAWTHTRARANTHTQTHTHTHAHTQTLAQ